MNITSKKTNLSGMATATPGDSELMPIRMPSLELPSGRHPFRRKPVFGLGVWTYVELLLSNNLPRHRFTLWQIGFVFAPGICDLSWWPPSGRLLKRRLVGGQLWIAPPGWELAVRWRETAEIVVLFVEPSRAERTGKLKDEMLLAKFADYVAAQPMIADYCADLRKFATATNGESDWHVACAGSHLAAVFLETHRLLGTGVLKPLVGLTASIVEAVRKFTVEQPRERLPVAEIARKLGTSSRTLRRIFRDVMSESPQKWALAQKARNAKRLLQSGHSIKETAVLGGFSDSRHLNRVLRTVFCVPASALQPHAVRPRLHAPP